MTKELHYQILDFLANLRDPESFGGLIPIEARTIARNLSRSILLSNIPGTSNEDIPRSDSY